MNKALAITALVVLALTLFAVTMPASAQNTWYVSPSGNDSSGNGSEGKPWRTIGKAVSVASDGDTVSLAAGTYTPGGDILLSHAITIEGTGADITTVTAGFLVTASDGVQPVSITGIACTAVTFGVSNPVSIVVTDCVVQSVEVDYPPNHSYTIEDSTVEGDVSFCYAAGGPATNIVRNCQIAGEVGFKHGTGTATTNTVEHCNVQEDIRFVHGPGTIVNTAEDCTVGGNIEFGHGATFGSNTARDCQVAGGISLQMGATLYNTISDNTVGGDIEDSSGVSLNTTISGNTLPSGSILDSSGGPEDTESEFIENNTLEDGVIESRGRNVTIRNNVITCSTATTGILTYSGYPTNIVGNTVTIPYVAPSGDDWWQDDEVVCALETKAGAGLVTDNTLQGGTCGIYDESGAFVVSGNNISNTHVGVYTRGAAEYKDNTITGCAGDGMIVNGKVGGPITGNTITDNGGAGIRIFKLVYAASTAASNGSEVNNMLRGNILNSNEVGIYLDDSDNNVISGNTCNGNSATGIYLDNSSDNTIYLNNFTDNGDNAYSEDSTNTWNSPDKITYSYKSARYTGYLGNHWGDYTGKDNGSKSRPLGDGVGDSNIPYTTDGFGDYYPLMEPSENYSDSWAYDENQDGIIQKMEAIHAIQDYFSGKISKAQAIEVIMLYFG